MASVYDRDARNHLKVKASHDYPGRIVFYDRESDASGNNDYTEWYAGGFDAGNDFMAKMAQVNADALALFEKAAPARAAAQAKKLAELIEAKERHTKHLELQIEETKAEISRLGGKAGS